MLPPLLADVNVAVPVVEFLRQAGVDVVSAYEAGWAMRDDASLLEEARAQARFVLTHDSDFGRLAMARGARVHGDLYLRPGDDPPATVIHWIRLLIDFPCDWTPPLVAVYRRGRLRLRRLS